LIPAILDHAVRFSVNLLPVVLFLLVLMYLDSYKLVRARTLVATILAGCAVALACMPLNRWIMEASSADPTAFARYGAPAVEEVFKAVCVAFLIRSQRVGFMVDAAIVGFAVGAGFAIVENIYYLSALGEASVVAWVVRGFGTAVMHGGTTCIFAILSKNIYDRRRIPKAAVFLPGLAVAVSIHSFYNHFIFSPVVSTIAIHAVLPIAILAVFYQSERSTRQWLGTQMDVDAALLEMINSGRVSETRVGAYFQSVKEQFPPDMVFDMLCYLRLHVELAISAKGLLLMREAGFQPPPPEGIDEKFAELRHLEKTIGRTGLIAVHPFLHSSTHDLWQLHMLGK
jgi:RsiW-degrading membrane proteinase PrsW (M82 family)